MGDQALISYQLVKKIYPARKFIIIASAIFIVLSLLIVLESAFMFTSTTRVGNPVLVIFSYLLAWFLIVVGLMGLKIACLANTLNTTVRSLSNTSSGRPGSAPAWISSPEMAPDIIPEFDLPGAVNSEFCLYPPPPPRYSSLGDVPAIPAAQTQAEPAPTATMYRSYHAASSSNQSPATQGTTTTNVLSPPPPY